MSFKELNYLKNLLGKLKPEEINLLKSFLKLRGGKRAKVEIKNLQLLNFLLKQNGGLTPSVLSGWIKQNNHSTIRLSYWTHQLKNKIYDTLLLNENIQRQEVFAPYRKVLLDVKKKIIQTHILRERGISQQVVKMYDGIIDKAKKYELYDELLEVLMLKQTFIGFLYGESFFKKMSREIELYEKCRDAFHRAVNWYYQVIMNVNFKGLHKKNGIKIGSVIAQMENDFAQTRSANVHYYLKLIQMEYYQLNKQYRLSLQISKKND